MSKNHVRNQAIKMAFENPHLRGKMIPLIQKLSGEDQGEEEEAKAGPSKKPGGKFIEFIKEMGDEKVRNPDTGNDVKLKSLGKTERGKKLQHEKFEKWLASQEKSKGKSDEKSKGKSDDKGGGSGSATYTKHLEGLDFTQWDQAKTEKMIVENANIYLNSKDLDEDHWEEDLRDEIRTTLDDATHVPANKDSDTRHSNVEKATDKIMSDVKKTMADKKKGGKPPAKGKGKGKEKENPSKKSPALSSKSQKKFDKLVEAHKLKPSALADTARDIRDMVDDPEGEDHPMGPSRKEYYPGLSDKEMTQLADALDAHSKSSKKASLRAQVIKIAHDHPELRADLLPLLQQAKVAGSWPIDERAYDSLRKGDRVMVESSGGGTSGKHILEVGRTSYSKKYDVYTKKLYYIDENTDLPMTKSRVAWNMFKRMSWRGEVYDPPQVSLAQGDMGVAIKSFAKVR